MVIGTQFKHGCYVKSERKLIELRKTSKLKNKILRRGTTYVTWPFSYDIPLQLVEAPTTPPFKFSSVFPSLLLTYSIIWVWGIVFTSFFSLHIIYFIIAFPTEEKLWQLCFKLQHVAMKNHQHQYFLVPNRYLDSSS